MCACVCVCQCLLFVGNKPLTTMGEDKWPKRKNCPSFTVFAPSPYAFLVLTYFFSVFSPTTTSTLPPPTLRHRYHPPVIVFFRTLTRAYLPHRRYIYTRPLVDDVNFSFVRVRKLLFFSAAYPRLTARSDV